MAGAFRSQAEFALRPCFAWLPRLAQAPAPPLAPAPAGSNLQWSTYRETLYLSTPARSYICTLACFAWLTMPFQRGNPVLEHIRNVAKQYSDIVPDFQVGRTTCMLFLRSVPQRHIMSLRLASLRYHRLHPEYIHQRIERLAHMYTLRILLLLCDIVRGRIHRLAEGLSAAERAPRFYPRIDKSERLPILIIRSCSVRSA